MNQVCRHKSRQNVKVDILDTRYNMYIHQSRVGSHKSQQNVKVDILDASYNMYIYESRVYSQEYELLAT